MRDPSGFDAFYAGHVRRLTGQMYAMTGSHAEAEDLVQEAFARAWQRWEKVSGYADPEAWVRTVACRLRVSAWRKTVNRLTAHHRHGPPEEIPGADPDYVAIIAALRRIPYEQRRAIVLHHLVGLSVEETARETGVPTGTVKARLARGRQAMAPYLSHPGTPAFADDAGRARTHQGARADHPRRLDHPDDRTGQEVLHHD
jgi:RNA polymerase sigma-70 factor (ECF subfamily)